MAFLSTHMKIFNKYVEQHFKAKPWVISLSLFFTCLFIDLPFTFALKIQSFGNYYYYDSNGLKNYATLYSATSSDFSSTILGKALLGFTQIFLNLVLSIIIGVTLNIVSVRLYRSYVKERREKEKKYARVAYQKKEDPIQATTSANQEINVVVPINQSKVLTQKEINENKAENNMFHMALTLCSLSILSRIIFILIFIYLFFFNSFSSTLKVSIINYSFYTLVPTSAIFIFYLFNKMFREEFGKKLFKKNDSNLTKSTESTNSNKKIPMRQQ